MRLFYNAAPVALLLLFAIPAAQSDCFGIEVFARAQCDCHDNFILCDKRGQISEFPVLNGTLPQVEEMWVTTGPELSLPLFTSTPIPTVGYTESGENSKCLLLCVVFH